MHIGLIIKKLIVEKSKLSLVDFAIKIGYSEPGMYDIFKKEDVSTKVLKVICNELNISLSDFFAYSIHSTKPIKAFKGSALIDIEAEMNYKEKYYEAIEKLNAVNEKLNACNERVIAFTDLKKDVIKKKK